MQQHAIKQMMVMMSGLLTMTSITAYAGMPLWTYSAPSPSTVSISDGGRATVTYTVTSQTNKAKSLVIQTNPPSPYPPTPGLTASTCNLPVKGSTCTLTVTIDGTKVPANGIHTGPYMCQSNGTPNFNQCYQPSAANILNITKNATQSTSLSVSVSNLALSVTGYREYGISGTPASGVARLITVTNTGSNTASNLSINSPTWPTGTTTTTTCGSTLAASATCTITVHPGSTATSDGTSPCTTGVAPTPQTISISADNASTVSSKVVVLGYGCIYQSGYVYAFDDTTAATGSVGGKVVTTTDQANAIIWSSNSSGTYDGGIPIYGISELSTTSLADPSSGQVSGQTACNGATDGSCNTNNIYIYYQTVAAGAPINLSYYAAGLCKQTINSLSDWYLPAICEMGYDAAGGGTGCGTPPGTPTLQNMQSNLVDLNNLNLLSGGYWSSTEGSPFPTDFAWLQSFASGGTSNQSDPSKGSAIGVRCSRALTI